MARNKLNHPHGDDGVKPPDNLNFQAGDKPDPEHFDWFWATVTSVVDGHTSEFTRLDSDNDGQVDAADTADDATNVTSTYKGNDLDTDGDGQVDAADTADTVVADGPFNGTATANALLTRVHTVSEGGTVPNGDAFNIWTTHLTDGETLSVLRYAFLSSDGTAVPSGVDLAIATLDGNGGFTRQTQIQGGGTVTYDATGSLSAPQATYTASSNGPVAVVVDNASGSKADVLTELTVITE